MMNGEQFNQGIRFLQRKGINLTAVFDLNDLPEELLSCVEESGVKIKDYQRLVLLGHAGQSLWKALNSEQKRLSDMKEPIDQFSRQTAEQMVKTCREEAPIELLYPGQHLVPLQQLGRLAGWHYDSPVGIGINKDYGLWFAYRALFLIDAELPLKRLPVGYSPCESCLDYDCVAACPAAALTLSESPEMGRCSQFRLEKSSPCRDRCLARESCPVAPELRYDREQISYHYLHSLAAIKEYDS